LPFTRFLFKPFTPPSANTTGAEFLANSYQQQEINLDRGYSGGYKTSCGSLVTTTTARPHHSKYLGAGETACAIYGPFSISATTGSLNPILLSIL
jgi:hypothetical protein